MTRLVLSIQDPLQDDRSAHRTVLDPEQRRPAVAKGTFEATLGVGTHRAACGGSCSLASCEQCYAATFNPSSKSWQIHSEGFFRGQVTAGPHKGCGIRWSLAGTFTALGTAQGPDPNHPWDFCGNL